MPGTGDGDRIEIEVFAPGHAEGPDPFDPDDDAAGTYTLVLGVTEPATIEVGALGEREFPPGGYAYTGSALGPGGFARVERHRQVATGARQVRHWHVNYLLGHPGVDLRAVVLSPAADVECAVARSLDSEVQDFGASDCDCRSHLAHRPSVAAATVAARRAHRRHR